MSLRCISCTLLTVASVSFDYWEDTDCSASYSPEGVGMGRNPPLWLKDGDVVEVYLENVGSCINKVEFEKQKAKL